MGVDGAGAQCAPLRVVYRTIPVNGGRRAGVVAPYGWLNGSVMGVGGRAGEDTGPYGGSIGGAVGAVERAHNVRPYKGAVEHR